MKLYDYEYTFDFMKQKKAAIVTWYSSKNFGSQLQAYALYKTITNLGYDVYMVYFHRHPLLRKIYYYIINSLPLCISRILNRQVDTPKYLFVKKYLKEVFINPTNSLTDFDAAICGSDQIWAPNVFNPLYMLSFISDNTTKLSYAASIGLNKIPDNLKDDYLNLLSRLSNISVREESGKKLLKECCGINASVVLDPTLLLSADEWKKIAKEVYVNSPYIFCYILNPSHNYKNKILDYQKRYGVKIIGLSENQKDSEWMEVLDYKRIGPEEFLGLILNASAVFTDSYHCTIFSIQFNKPFITFERFNNSDALCQNSRIQQLDSYFNIENNIKNPNTSEQLNAAAINYLDFENKRVKLKFNSINYLKSSLSIC